MPLEHKFWHARVGACDVHTLGRFTNILAKFQTFDIQADQIKILGRSSFGQFVDDEEDDGQNYKQNEIEIMMKHFGLQQFLMNFWMKKKRKRKKEGLSHGTKHF